MVCINFESISWNTKSKKVYFLHFSEYFNLKLTNYFDFSDTGWLDKLIAERVRGKKPDIILGVMCASVHIADNTIQDAFNHFHNSLEK